VISKHGYNSYIQQYRKGFKTRTRKYVRVSRTFGTSFSGSLPHQEYSDPQYQYK
jgi:hypothetical protein